MWCHPWCHLKIWSGRSAFSKRLAWSRLPNYFRRLRNANAPAIPSRLARPAVAVGSGTAETKAYPLPPFASGSLNGPTIVPTPDVLSILTSPPREVVNSSRLSLKARPAANEPSKPIGPTSGREPANGSISKNQSEPKPIPYNVPSLSNARLFQSARFDSALAAKASDYAVLGRLLPLPTIHAPQTLRRLASPIILLG